MYQYVTICTVYNLCAYRCLNILCTHTVYTYVLLTATESEIFHKSDFLAFGEYLRFAFTDVSTYATTFVENCVRIL